MMNSSRPQTFARNLLRGLGLLSTGMVAAAALVAAPRQASAACPDGETIDCTTDDGCEGFATCDGLHWSECMAFEDCNAPKGYDPSGPLDEVNLDASGNNVTVHGWTFDWDSVQSQLQVRISVDGVTQAYVLANQYRPDVGAAYPGVGNYHGYVATFPALDAGHHYVCAYAYNVGLGSNRQLGCQYYSVEGKVTTTWGQSDVTRCVDDPIGAISSLPTTGPNFGFITSSSSEGLVYSPGSPHWQGVTRLAFGDGQYLVTSRSGSYMFYVVRMGAQGWSGAPFGSGVSTWNYTAVRWGNNPNIGFDHAGGVQALGTLLAVPNENHVTEYPDFPVEIRTQINFFNMSNPTSPQPIGFVGRDVLVSDEAGAVALARLRNNRILMAVGRAESNMLDFYVSGSDQPTGWSYRDTWWQSELHTTLPDGDDEFGDYQGLSFVTRCGDGALFLVGTHKAGDLFGADWVDLFHVELYGSSAYLTKVAKRHVDCGQQCDLDAGGGAYVTPSGRLIVYGVEHAADGPVLNGQRSVKAREF
jgi:hypothetical protein